MSAIRIHRYVVDPADVDDLIARRATLIAAIRAKHPGLVEARLIRLRDDTYIDSWRWESKEQMKAALAAGAPALPEARAAWSLTRDASKEDGEVVDER
jgi:hypothetical protein